MKTRIQIELDATDVGDAITKYIREKTGRDVASVFKVERERGGVAFSVPTCYDLGPELEEAAVASHAGA